MDELRKSEGREIVPGVFLGSRLAAMNYEWLAEKGIRYVLNVTGETRNYYEGDGGRIVVLVYEIFDSWHPLLLTTKYAIF